MAIPRIILFLGLAVNILVRYKQTFIGIAWALLRPFLTMLVFTFVFGKLARLPSDGAAPYPILVFAGVLPWQFFASSLAEASNSLIDNANLISKVYFPRLIVPTSAVIVSFVDFLLSGMILLGLMAWYNFLPSWRILTLPLFILMAFATSMGGGLWLSALNVQFGDFRYIVPFIIQFGLYISPVGFSSNIVPEKWRWLYSLNPMVGVIDGFRWAIIGGDASILARIPVILGPSRSLASQWYLVFSTTRKKLRQYHLTLTLANFFR
jgi:lipopolysaccharide transport system permease protein